MKKTIKNAYSDFFIFLKNPADAPTNNRPIETKFKRLFAILLLDVAAMTICMLLLSLLERTGLFSTDDNKLYEMLKSMPVVTFGILCIFVIPLIEELIFRLYLRYKTNYVLRILVSLTYVAGKKNKECVEAWVKKTWHQQYRYVFYFSALLFGFVHIFNYDFNPKTLFLFPILTLPQIVAGLLMSYLRVRYKLVWSFFLHALHNSIFLLPVIFIAAGTNKVEVNNNDHFIKIEKSILNEKPGMIFYKDSISIKNTSLKDVVSATTGYNILFIESDNEKLMNEKYNLLYKNRIDSTHLDKDKINEQLTKFCNFEMNKVLRNEGVLKLVIEDSVKLNQHKVDEGKQYWIKFPKDSAVFFNTPYTAIASLMQTPTKKKVFSTDTLTTRYTIKLQTKELKDLNNQLSSVYGLRLIDSTAEVEHLVIDFKTVKE